MKNYKRRSKTLQLTPFTFLMIVIPLVLIALFYALRNQTKVMEWWTNHGMYPVVQWIGSVSSLVPFSLGEAMGITLALVLFALLMYRIYGRICGGIPFFHLQDFWGISSLALWVWCWMCWMWNPLYYIPSFAQRSGLDLQPYPLEDLVAVTEYFAQETSKLSGEMPRNEEGYFMLDRETYFQEALTLYEKLEQSYPFLQRHNVQVKALRLSWLQSVFGFTGVYIPFTGEANINVHTPSVLHPVTIAHEMAHQRLIAPELEANFLAVVACLDSEDLVFQYSGYLFGLIQLSNALYPVAPEVWTDFVEVYFTTELRRDWAENYDYWQQFSSPVEDVVKEVYDGFLKSNDQSLGIRSYGACVDLLVAYYG